LTLRGTASDDVGVTQVRWANSRGGSGTASGTTSWTASGIVLQTGSNVLTVTARDAAGNTATDTLTVTLDTTAPKVTITSPTSNGTYTTTRTSLTLGGTASDNIGVTQVRWANSRGGSGTASGTTSWTTSGISLQTGTNVLTVTARDAAGNTLTDTVTITRN
jgi:Bacterial Ig domain/Bacterial Ig-like domain